MFDISNSEDFGGAVIHSMEACRASGEQDHELLTGAADGPVCVTIVLCTYQGGMFLEDQLHSISAQTHINWHLLVSDDGSTDRTREIVESFKAERADKDTVVLINGPRSGFAANFLTTLCRAGKTPYYAFSDQDDIWEADKLTRALSVLEAVPSSQPALYCGRTRLVDEIGHPIGLSPAFMRPPSFANALVQNIGGGNTMVMNHAARELLCAAGPDMDIVSHDWWAYQLISGAGGLVYYDIEPSVLYRQHGNNLVGKNNDIGDRISRLRFLFRGRFQEWTDRNIRVLNRTRHLLTPQSQALLDVFAKARIGSAPQRFAALWRSGVYRQTMLGNIGLIVATVFNKL